mmetsp:Transcript_26444/g.40967  ORF Transcript_26444/g.40967 Transcript_26444/m.40967 type:complete len:137 (+) Transcript_26444:1526-1936(+)
MSISTIPSCASCSQAKCIGSRPSLSRTLMPAGKACRMMANPSAHFFPLFAEWCMGSMPLESLRKIASGNACSSVLMTVPGGSRSRALCSVSIAFVAFCHFFGTTVGDAVSDAAILEECYACYVLYPVLGLWAMYIM